MKLQSRFSQLLNKDRTVIHNPEKLLRWFQLIKSIIQKYDIQQKNTYNIDKKEFALDIANRVKVIGSRDNLYTYITQNGNREQISLIKCIFANKRLLILFIIFKDKRIIKTQTSILEDKDI